MTVYFTSDTHFYHSNVIKYSKRPFNSLEEMHESLVFNWNSKVGKHDTVYHLGDFFLTDKVEDIDFILEQLNGTIRLVKGNHDSWVKRLDRLKNKHKIEWVKDYFEHKFSLNGANQKVVMMHYPMRSWNQSHFGSWMLHGHTHGCLDEENRASYRMDVGVDSWIGKYSPVSFDQIAKTLSNPNLEVTPHH